MHKVEGNIFIFKTKFNVVGVTEGVLLRYCLLISSFVFRFSMFYFVGLVYAELCSGFNCTSTNGWWDWFFKISRGMESSRMPRADSNFSFLQRITTLSGSNPSHWSTLKKPTLSVSSGATLSHALGMSGHHHQQWQAVRWPESNQTYQSLPTLKKMVR